jgi:hypothetical protein
MLSGSSTVRSYENWIVKDPLMEPVWPARSLGVIRACDSVVTAHVAHTTVRLFKRCSVVTLAAQASMDLRGHAEQGLEDRGLLS